jgi:ComF family protein
MWKEIEKMGGYVLDMVFPIECIGCGKNLEELPSRERWICPSCLLKIEMRRDQVCPACEKESEGGETHYGCRGQTPLDGLWVAAYYGPLIEKAVHDLKFAFLPELAYPLSQLMVKSILETEEYAQLQDMLFAPRAKEAEEEIYAGKKEAYHETVIVPVPLHRKRLNWRGFNQASLLAHRVGEKFALPVAEDLVTRCKNTKPQSKTESGQERKCNIAGAFLCPEAPKVRGRNIILVDDLCTTAATLNECAGALKTAGAHTVWGLVVARR